MQIDWDSHTLTVLEFPLVRAMWAEQTDTPIGYERVMERTLSADLELVQVRLQETTEATQLLMKEPPPGMSSCKEVRPLISKAQKGGVLAGVEFRELLDAVRTIRLYKEYLQPREERYPRLAHHAQQMQAFKSLEQAIESCIAPGGEILDEASESLAQIRSEQRKLQKRIADQLQSMLSSHRWREILQEPIYTIRSGRYCLPVRSEYKARVKGIVHDSSMSGATVYIEPEELVQLGNRTRELESHEQEEIERILYGLSRGVEAEAEPLMNSVTVLSELDAIIAAGRLGLDMDACEPEINCEGVWRLRHARHPLLDPATVVPVDVEIGREFQAVLITGPNTGGKTVTLKTTGLLTLMTLAGLHVPADIGTKIAIPTGIFADIGDEQSLQQSLSTFSGHIRHIVRYLSAARENSLVLLDEIGAGTDPTEGAALAKAILLTLVEAGARVIATTHYGELKAFAYEHPAFQNAAMEFDLETLRPTYRLRLGVPGASHAISIAQRLGIPPGVIQSALDALGTQQVDLMRMISKLEAAQHTAEQVEAEYARLVQETETLKERLADELEAANQARREAKQAAQLEVEETIRQLREEANAILQELRKAQRESKQTTDLQKKLETTVRQVKQKTTETPDIPLRSELLPKPEIKKGVRVKVLSLGQVGTVLSEPKNGEVQVQIGSLRATFKMADLDPIPEKVAPAKKKTVRVSASTPRRMDFMPDIDLHGKRAEEALQAVERFIDDALLQDYDHVRIMHGKGSGALQKVVRNYLKTHPWVARFYDADPEHGGSGTTIVQFKRG